MRYVLLAALFTLFSTSLYAEVFSWTDKSGIQHFTDDPANIPAKYRDRVVLKGSSEGKFTPPVTAKAKVPASDFFTPAATQEQDKSSTRPKTAVEILAGSLLEKATTDRDKAYAAFNWIRSNVYYDNATKWQRRYGQSGSDQRGPRRGRT